ncbi:glycosyltransferase family 2 protein [Cystobacter ferrugineus]|uniref:Glycosyl transferase n=1 Tax=Cystobacter ferrugineus TaxID=83449 RepID=A0A1L9BDV6_9BACT|nr:glycosyltransferase family 2 protein [Cystobacter ferrugineus]OJH40408.1 glycosyl transferase [Cystobacter ferrugineus]
MTPSIAVLVPCLNEEAAIASVVRDFRQALPGATIYVYDNGSTDKTCAVARAAGAVVRTEPLRGKGNVVRRMFADVEADVYVLVDGDDTYHAASAPALIQMLVSEQLDMVNASRVTDVKEAYRLGHRFGNRMLTGLVATLFGNRFRDILSGYRVFSRRFVKSFPAASAGFEIETELTVHALELRMPLSEADTPYKDRPAGSTSKLRTFRDGWRILLTILKLLKEERPMLFFSSIFGALLTLALVLAYPIFVTYEQTGLVPRLPTAVLSMGITLLAFLSLGCGIILDTVSRSRQDLKRLRYLSFPAVPRELTEVGERWAEPERKVSVS